MNVKELNQLLKQSGIELINLGKDVKFLTRNIAYAHLYQKYPESETTHTIGSVIFEYGEPTLKGPTITIVRSINIFQWFVEDHKELCTTAVLHDLWDNERVTDYDL